MLTGSGNGPLIVNQNHPLLKGAVSWWLALPHRMGGARFIDLLSGVNGALKGGPSWVGSGCPTATGALRCDAAGEGADITIPPSLKLPLPITLNCWIRAVGTPADNATICGTIYDDAAGSPFTCAAFYTHQTDGFLSLTGNDAGSFYQVSSTVTTASRTTWTMVTGIFNASYQDIYINGALDTHRSVTIANPTYSSTSLICAGGRTGASLNSNIELNEQLFIGREWTAAEVRQWYDLSRSGYPGLLIRRPLWLNKAAAAAGQFLLVKG